MKHYNSENIIRDGNQLYTLYTIDTIFQIADGVATVSFKEDVSDIKVHSTLYSARNKMIPFMVAEINNKRFKLISIYLPTITGKYDSLFEDHYLSTESYMIRPLNE